MVFQVSLERNYKDILEQPADDRALYVFVIDKITNQVFVFLYNVLLF